MVKCGETPQSGTSDGVWAHVPELPRWLALPKMNTAVTFGGNLQEGRLSGLVPRLARPLEGTQTHG